MEAPPRSARTHIIDAPPRSRTRARDAGGALARALDALARIAVAAPRVMLVVVLATALPAAWLASRLELRTSFLDLLSPHDPEARSLFEVLARTGGLGFSTILVPAVDRGAAERVVDAIDREVGALPFVRYVDGRRDTKFLEDHALQLAEPATIEVLVRDVKSAVDHAIAARAGYLLDDEPAPPSPIVALRRARSDTRADALDAFTSGRDGRYLYVSVALAGAVGELDTTVARQAEVERIARLAAKSVDPAIELRFSGPIVNRRDDADVLRADLTRAGSIGLVLVGALVAAFFRRVRAVVLLALPLALAMMWLFAVARLAIGHLNVLSGFLVSILTGLGVEHGIHLLRRFDDARAEGSRRVDAVRVAVVGAGPAIVGACLANAAVFAVIAVAGFRGFVEFGLLAAVGMLLSMFATLLVLPPVLVLAAHADPRPRARPLRPIDPSPRLRVAIVLATSLGLVASLVALSRGAVRFRADFRELAAPTPSSALDAYVASTLPASTTQLALVLDDAADLPRVRDAFQQVRAARAARGEPTHVRGVLGVDRMLPTPDPARTAALAALGHELARVRPGWLANDDERTELARARTLASAPAYGVDALPASLSGPLRTADGRGTVALVETEAVLDDVDSILAWSDEVAELRRALATSGVRGALASESAVAGRIFRLVVESGPRLLVATLALLFLVVLLELGRPARALAIVASVGAGLVLTGGAMALFGLDLDFMNAAVLPMILGVSVDNAIHLDRRLAEVGPDGFGLAWRQTGAAAVASSLTNLAGFASLLVARGGGLVSVGRVSVIGIVATLVTTTLAYPIVRLALARARVLRTSRP